MDLSDEARIALIRDYLDNRTERSQAITDQTAEFLLNLVDKQDAIIKGILALCEDSESHTAQFNDVASIYVDDVKMTINSVWNSDD